MKRERVRFFRCPICGNIVEMINDGGGTLVCCGQPMIELKANTTEAVVEKHVPSVKIENGVVSVQVGSVLHPMIPEHYIQWIALETAQGVSVKFLQPGDQPVMTFCNTKDILAVYEYCNLHGLWKLEMQKA